MNKTQSIVNLCFVVPYFGKLPKTMQAFLDSAGCNPEYDWLIFTDDDSEYKYPPNVRVIYMSFSQMQKRIQDTFSFPISIETPKKLCDYKPAYGFIFKDELKEYDYWGYCDLDMILGDLSIILTKEYLDQYDKIFTLGHMAIYRNNDPVNKLFMCEYKCEQAKYKSYVHVFQEKKNLAFDEWPENCVNINVLAEQEGMRLSGDWPMADILPHRSSFIESFYCLKEHKWSDGQGPSVIVTRHAERLFVTQTNPQDSIEQREIIYAHIQKRKLSVSDYAGANADFVIVPNKIVSVDALNIEKIEQYLGYGKWRRAIRADEVAWKFEQVKGIWKHRVNKISKMLIK